jgi:hypothetical protein
MRILICENVSTDKTENQMKEEVEQEYGAKAFDDFDIILGIDEEGKTHVLQSRGVDVEDAENHLALMVDLAILNQVFMSLTRLGSRGSSINPEYPDLSPYGVDRSALEAVMHRLTSQRKPSEKEFKEENVVVPAWLSCWISDRLGRWAH